MRSGSALGTGLLPPGPPRHRPGRRAAPAAAVLAAGLGTALATALLTGPPAPPDPGPAIRPAVVPTAPGTLAQYDYVLRLPPGWRHTGGLPEHRRVLLTPAGTPRGSDLIAVEQTPLGYDSAAEPDRAGRELAERFAAAARTDPGLHGPPRPGRFAGRLVLGYRQTLPALGATVDWYVLFDRDAQLSVGCQHTGPGTADVATACAGVVGSVARRDTP